MTDTDERLNRLERFVLREWRKLVKRVSRVEAQIEKGDGGVDQSRQQDRWTGALWISAWAIVTGLLIAGVVIALLRYQ